MVVLPLKTSISPLKIIVVVKQLRLVWAWSMRPWCVSYHIILGLFWYFPPRLTAFSDKAPGFFRDRTNTAEIPYGADELNAFSTAVLADYGATFGENDGFPT